MGDHILHAVAFYAVGPVQGRKLSQDFCSLLCSLFIKGRKRSDATASQTGSAHLKHGLEGWSFRLQFGALLNLHVVTSCLVLSAKKLKL